MLTPFPDMVLRFPPWLKAPRVQVTRACKGSQQWNTNINTNTQTDTNTDKNTNANTNTNTNENTISLQR